MSVYQRVSNNKWWLNQQQMVKHPWKYCELAIKKWWFNEDIMEISWEYLGGQYHQNIVEILESG